MSKNGNINDNSPIKSGTNGSDQKKYAKGFDGIDFSKKLPPSPEYLAMIKAREEKK